MNELIKAFNHEEFGNVRCALIDGKELFVAKDIAVALGYSNPRDAISRHCKGVVKHDSFKDGGNCISLIQEGDIYRLIVKSKLPSAVRFEKWVMEEVLPSIRKNGAYMTEQTLEKALTSPDFLIQLATQLKGEQEARRIAETKLEEAKPKILFAEAIEGTGDYISMGEMSKLLQKDGFEMGRNTLYAFLREKKILMEDNIPYQRYMEWFYLKESNKNGYLCLTPFVTPHGQVKITNLAKKGL